MKEDYTKVKITILTEKEVFSDPIWEKIEKRKYTLKDLGWDSILEEK